MGGEMMQWVDGAFQLLGIAVVSAAAGIVLAVVAVGIVALAPARWREWLRLS